LYLQAGVPTLDEIAGHIEAWADDLDLSGAPGRDTIGWIIGGTEVPPSPNDTVANWRGEEARGDIPNPRSRGEPFVRPGSSGHETV
jgi:hypothetical protein